MRVAQTWMLLTAGVVSLACYQEDPFGQIDAGATAVFLTGAGVPHGLVDRIEVYVSEVAASTDADSVIKEWVTITRPGRAFDVLPLRRGRTALLGWGDLSPDSYHSVRVSLRGDSSRVVMRDGREASVRWPASGEFSVRAWVQEPVEITDAGAQLVVDLDVGRSLVNALADPLHDFVFLAHMRAVNGSVTGTLTGTVTGDADGNGTVEAIPNAVVTVVWGDLFPSSPWFTTARDQSTVDGVYRIAFLMPDTYLVQVDVPGSTVLGSVTVGNVTIVPGQVTTYPVHVPPATTPMPSTAR